MQRSVFGRGSSRIRLNDRRTIFVIVGALLVFGFVVLALFLLFSSSGAPEYFDPLFQIPFTESDPQTPYSILITGGAGFIGSHVVEYFLSDDVKAKLPLLNVFVVDNLVSGRMENLPRDDARLIVVEDGIEKESTWQWLFTKYQDRNIRYVFHLAALISAPESVYQPEEYYRVNALGTMTMLKAFSELEGAKSVKRVVFASSAAVYSNVNKAPRDELTTPMDCRTPYAQTKYDGEFFMQLYSEVRSEEKKEDFFAISTRFFNVFGERQDPNSDYAAVIPKFVEKACIQKEPMLIFGDGKQTRDFVYVKDVVGAMVHLAFHLTREDAKNAAYRLVFNVGYSESITINRLSEVINGWCSIGNANNYVVHKPPRIGDPRYSEAKTDRLKQTGWRPRYSKFGVLKRTVDWFREEYEANAKNASPPKKI